MAVPDRRRNHDDARLRNVRKKLVQIAALEEKLKANPALELTNEQREKLSRKVDLEAELNSLLMPAVASCGFSNDVIDPTCKDKVDKGVTVLAKCSHCELLVQPFTAPWSTWYCSRCGQDELTLRSPAYGCRQQDTCVKLDDWAICEVCAKADATMHMEKICETGNCDKISDSNCSSQVSASCPTCTQTLHNFVPPWSTWHCSECGQDDLTTSSPAFACPKQDSCRNIQDWAICECCATAKTRPPSCDGEVEDLNGPTFQRMTSGHWKDDPIAVEDIMPSAAVTKEDVGVKAKGKSKKAGMEDFEILEAVQPFSAATKASDRMRGLIKAVSELSNEAFGSDVLEGVSRKGKWKLTLLARRSTDGPWGGLLGFIAYKVKPEVQVVSVAKLAVVPEERGKGHGHRIVNWCIAMAKKQQNIMHVSLTSLPAAVRFYKQMGFRAIDVDFSRLPQDDPDDEESDYIEGQVYMEYLCKKGRGAGASKAKRR